MYINWPLTGYTFPKHRIHRNPNRVLFEDYGRRLNERLDDRMCSVIDKVATQRPGGTGFESRLELDA